MVFVYSRDSWHAFWDPTVKANIKRWMRDINEMKWQSRRRKVVTVANRLDKDVENKDGSRLNLPDRGYDGAPHDLKSLDFIRSRRAHEPSLFSQPSSWTRSCRQTYGTSTPTSPSRLTSSTSTRHGLAHSTRDPSYTSNQKPLKRFRRSSSSPDEAGGALLLLAAVTRLVI